MKLNNIIGIAVLLLAGWALIVGSGRNPLSLWSKDGFITMQQKYGRTLKMLGAWGLVIGSIYLTASFL